MNCIYELVPTNRRKSFYGKAKVIVDGNRHYLMSYDTIMGMIEAESGTMHRYSNYYSVTTNNHVIAFTGGRQKEFWALPLEDRPTIKLTV